MSLAINCRTSGNWADFFYPVFNFEGNLSWVMDCWMSGESTPAPGRDLVVFSRFEIKRAEVEEVLEAL